MAAIPAPPPSPAAVKRSRRTLVLIAAVALAPIVASYSAYYLWPRAKHVNYGELLPTAPAPEIDGTRVDGKPFRLADLRGRWIVASASPGRCEAACERTLYATRQARTIQGSEQQRVVRVWISTDNEPAGALGTQHPGLEIVRVAPSALESSRLADGRIYLIDPLGNWVLAWPADPDIKKLANDLGRLLRASQIG
jgi:hypothetical protein